MRLLRTCLLMAVCAGQGSIFAQDKAIGQETLVLEEIVVTATKREVKLHDLPLSVGVLTGEQLYKINGISMDDYWRMIPSMNVKDGPLGGSTAIIRGLSDSVSFSQPESLNAFYIDDTAITYVPGLYATPGDPALVDVARIEILRGPQGSLGGANARWGVCRFRT